MINVQRGTAADAPALTALFDDAIAWLAARGQTGQWGSVPFSDSPERLERVEAWAASGELWFASDDTTGEPERVGAIVLGDRHDYIPPPDRPELYVLVLLTRASHRNRGVGALLVEHAAQLARRDGAEQLRVDCWAGVPELPAAYERLGFVRWGEFEVRGWPGAILIRPL